MNLLINILIMIWLMLPAYLSNPAASIAISATGKGIPIDLGKEIKGRRILGDGKTYKGFISGVIFGSIVGLIQNFINIVHLNESLPVFSYKAIIALSIGAMLGDLIASFFKRRLGLKRGQLLPLIDQLDFVLGAWALTILAAPDWFFENFTMLIIILTLLITPILHLLLNIIGYRIGLSKEPW